MNRYDIILEKDPPPSPESPKEEEIYGESMLVDFCRQHFLEQLMLGKFQFPK
jgi:hypothetical protein